MKGEILQNLLGDISLCSIGHLKRETKTFSLKHQLMKHLKDWIRKELAQKHLGKNMIGAIAINIVKDYFKDQTIEGYVKFNKMFVKVNDQNFKIEIFKQKILIIQKVNEALSKVGYKTQIVEIFIK